MSKKPYRLLASLLLMLVATLTSCEKFSIDETTGKSREANANVTIHVQKIEGISLLTTKAADKQMALGDVCSRLTLAILTERRTGDGEPAFNRQWLRNSLCKSGRRRIPTGGDCPQRKGKLLCQRTREK